MINKLTNTVFSWLINYDLMILINDSEHYHKDRAAAVTEANVNEIQREIQSNTELNNK